MPICWCSSGAHCIILSCCLSAPTPLGHGQYTRRQLEAKEAEAAAAAEVLAEVGVRVAAATQEFDGARERLTAERQALAADSAECDAAQAQVGVMRSVLCMS